MKETGTVKKFFSQHSLDVAGFWISAVCGLHCVAVPLLVSLAAIRVSSLLVHSVEYLALGFSVTLGVISLLPSFFKHHRNGKPLVVLSAGFMAIALGRLIESYEVWFTVSGATLVACAHVLNYRLCRKHPVES